MGVEAKVGLGGKREVLREKTGPGEIFEKRQRDRRINRCDDNEPKIIRRNALRVFDGVVAACFVLGPAHSK
jgi:hypothetical protein